MNGRDALREMLEAIARSLMLESRDSAFMRVLGAHMRRPLLFEKKTSPRDSGVEAGI